MQTIKHLNSTNMATSRLVVISSYLLLALSVINLGAWPKATSAYRVYSPKPPLPPSISDMNVAREPSLDLNGVDIQSEPIKPGHLPDHLDGEEVTESDREGGVRWSQHKDSFAMEGEAGISNNGGGSGVHGTVGSGRGFSSVGASANAENDSDVGASNPGFDIPGLNVPVPSFNIPNVGFGVGFGGGAGMGMGGNGVGAGSGLGAGSGGPGVIGIGQGSGAGIGAGTGGMGFGAGVGWGVGIGGSGGNLPIGSNVLPLNPPQGGANTPGGGSPFNGSNGGNNDDNDDSGTSVGGAAAPAPAPAPVEGDGNSIPNCSSNSSPEPSFASGLRCEPLNCSHGECSAITLYFSYNPSSSSSTTTSKEDRQSKNEIHKSVTPISDEVIGQMRMDNMDGDKVKTDGQQSSTHG